MIIALFALAILMIVGGVASVVQGFPFVRLESGMAMTVAGATTASAGAVVLGLAAVASHLRGLGRRLGELRSASPSAEGRPTDAAPRPLVSNLSDPAPGDTSARQRPSLGGPSFGNPGPRDEAGFGGPTFAGTGLAGTGLAAGLATASFAANGEGKTAFGAGPQARGTEPTFAPSSEPEPVEPLPPDLLPPAEGIAPALEAEREAPAPSEANPIVQENNPTPTSFEPDLAAAPEEPLHLYPTFDTTTDAAPEPAPQPPVIEHEPDVVGTYKSGSNTYVMFSNGVIEADTPRGRFSFESLDELKAFVAAGGENDARGAA